MQSPLDEGAGLPLAGDLPGEMLLHITRGWGNAGYFLAAPWIGADCVLRCLEAHVNYHRHKQLVGKWRGTDLAKTGQSAGNSNRARPRPSAVAVEGGWDRGWPVTDSVSIFEM